MNARRPSVMQRLTSASFQPEDGHPRPPLAEGAEGGCVLRDRRQHARLARATVGGPAVEDHERLEAAAARGRRPAVDRGRIDERRIPAHHHARAGHPEVAADPRVDDRRRELVAQPGGLERGVCGGRERGGQRGEREDRERAAGHRPHGIHGRPQSIGGPN
jgi:hypothetical protein